MPPKDRKRPGLVSLLFRRKRRSTKRVDPNQMVQSNVVPKKRRRFKDYLQLIKRSFKSISTDALVSDSRSGTSDHTFSGIIKSLSKTVTVNKLTERDGKSSDPGKNRSRLQKLKHGVVKNFKRLLLATPAIVLFVFALRLVLDLSPNRLVRQLGFTNRFDRAFAEQRIDEANLLVKNQISAQNRPSNQDLFRYALVLASQQEIQRTRELLEFLTETSDRSFGPAHLEMARAYSALPKQTDQSSSKIESHLIRAMIDSDTTVIARISLGRLYRKRGRFNDAERILEPIRTNEEACIELALVRNAQGRFADVPTTVAPYITRWRDQWKNPQDIGQFERSAIGLILMAEEESVLAGLDNPKLAISPTRLDELRRLAIGLWMARLLAQGVDQYPQVLKIIATYQQKLPCSPIWISPLMQITQRNSPVRDSALKLRDQMTLQSECDPSFLHEFAVQGKDLEEMGFARQIYEKILLKYPDEILSLNNLAILLIETNPKDPQRALKLVEPIIQKYPDFLEIYDTRAQIKSTLGVNKDSIQDYLKALPVYCLKPEYHLRLSKAYRMSNDLTNARIHEELANEISGLQ